MAPSGDLTRAQLAAHFRVSERVLKRALAKLKPPGVPSYLDGRKIMFPPDAIQAVRDCMRIDPNSPEEVVKREAFLRKEAELRAGRLAAKRAAMSAGLKSNADIMAMAAPRAKMCGIYFLIQAGKIVYVGQSVAIQSRVEQHVRSGRTFQAWAWVPCRKADLIMLERLYIERLRPRLNRDGVTMAALRKEALGNA